MILLILIAYLIVASLIKPGINYKRIILILKDTQIQRFCTLKWNSYEKNLQKNLWKKMSKINSVLIT